jgi:hypothetical protein
MPPLRFGDLLVRQASSIVTSEITEDTTAIDIIKDLEGMKSLQIF